MHKSLKSVGGNPKLADLKMSEEELDENYDILIEGFDIIKCNECKYWHEFDSISGYGSCSSRSTSEMAFRYNDYCSFAEPKTQN